MNRNCFFCLLFSFFSICLFFSCAKEDSDSQAPSVELFSLLDGDTIVTDSSYLLSVRFADDKGLSSYSVNIWNMRLNGVGDTTQTVAALSDSIVRVQDSALFNGAFQDINIFGKRDTVLNISAAFRVDSTIFVRGKRLPVALGHHFFKLSVADMYGNIAMDSVRIYVVKHSKL